MERAPTLEVFKWELPHMHCLWCVWACGQCVMPCAYNTFHSQIVNMIDADWTISIFTLKSL